MPYTDPAPSEETHYLRLNDFLPRIKISRPTLYRLVAKDAFPKPVKFGASSLWVEHEIQAWERQRMDARQ